MYTATWKMNRLVRALNSLVRSHEIIPSEFSNGTKTAMMQAKRSDILYAYYNLHNCGIRPKF